MALPSLPISLTHLVTANILQCSACKKIFKSKQGLSQHEAIVRRYNSFHVDSISFQKNLSMNLRKL